MRILHTSDWHIGRSLYGRRRYHEFASFLDWLAQAIVTHQADALLVAGDIFDSITPGNQAQELYYRFLCRVAASSCRHVVIIAGNHDSPSFLNAPRELLRALNVHVVGGACENPEDEVLVLSGDSGLPELIVCAVPFLRDRDIRIVEAGESIEDKERKLLDGIRAHYAGVVALAERKRTCAEIPLVGMGHLFTADGQTVDGDGVRDLYVGSLVMTPAAVFPECLDYLALGHLHVPQKVAGSDTRRYSGSPLPMGFGEAKQQKSVCLVDFSGRNAAVRLLEIPVFQELERIKGSWETISGRIRELTATGSQAWLEIIYEGNEVMGDLRERLDGAISGSALEILRVKNNSAVSGILDQGHARESLDDLDVYEVFERCLTAHNVPEEQRPELQRAYREAVSSLFEGDAGLE